MGEVDGAFGHADVFAGLEGGDCEGEGAGVG